MHTLIDLGATHSFVSYATVDLANLSTKESCVTMSVETPMGTWSYSHQVVPEYPILIKGAMVSVDFNLVEI